jgi:DNA-binding beta-propeller fold protein YncE
MKKLFVSLSMIYSILYLPITALAHGSDEEHQKELLLGSILKYGMIFSAILFIVGTFFWLRTKKRIKRTNVKNQESRIMRDRLKKVSKVYGSLSLLGLLVLTGLYIALPQSNSGSENGIEFMHIHGLGFSGDGKNIYVPAHDGLNVFTNEKWKNHEKGEKHDYMGFSMMDKGFYSSGHPAPGSDMKNPFGIVKSEDMGETLQTLDLYGEIDFHGMGVGYYSHTIYVLNPEPNSRMDEAGLYYTLDEAKTWKKSQMNGLSGQPSTIAVHPKEKNIIAIATDEGVFYSDDFGSQFKKIIDSQPTSIVFNTRGELLAASYTINGSSLEIVSENGTTENINIPKIQEEDAISYIAVNPINRRQIVFSTFSKDIYLTNDNGNEWEQIVSTGIGNSGDQE